MYELSEKTSFSLTDNCFVTLAPKLISIVKSSVCVLLTYESIQYQLLVHRQRNRHNGNVSKKERKSNDYMNISKS